MEKNDPKFHMGLQKAALPKQYWEENRKREKLYFLILKMLQSKNNKKK